MPRRHADTHWADPALLILSSLAEGPRHGAAIVADVAAAAGVRLGPGTLYEAIARLESRGLVEPLPAQDRRRPYRLTTHGAEVLATEVRRMRRLVEHTERRLSTSGIR